MGAVAAEEPVVVLRTTMQERRADGAVGARDVGMMPYTPTALHMLQWGIANPIELSTNGGLRGFTIYEFAPGVFYPNGIYECESVRLDEQGRLLHLEIINGNGAELIPGGCTPIATISGDPPVIHISCRNDSCEEPKVCNLYQTVINPPTYVCKCQSVAE